MFSFYSSQSVWYQAALCTAYSSALSLPKLYHQAHLLSLFPNLLAALCSHSLSPVELFSLLRNREMQKSTVHRCIMSNHCWSKGSNPASCSMLDIRFASCDLLHSAYRRGWRNLSSLNQPRRVETKDEQAGTSSVSLPSKVSMEIYTVSHSSI